MRSTLFSVLVIWMLLVNSEISCRMCYQCSDDECEQGPGKAVDCEGIACGVVFDFSGTDGAKGRVEHRGCLKTIEDDTEYVCWMRLRDGRKFEYCVCDQELCNGEDPKCGERNRLDPDVKAALADKCSDESAS